MLDIERHTDLDRYLRVRSCVGPDEPLSFQTLTGGVSNRTVLVRRFNGRDLVVKQALAKLRVEVDWFSDPARVQREAAAMRWLGKVVPRAVPQLVHENPEADLIVMSAVPEPHENWKHRLLGGRVDAALVWRFGSLLGQIHRRATSESSALAGEFSDQSWFLSLRVEPYYLFTADRVHEAAAFLRDLAASSTEPAWTFVHGDYSPKNILVHDEGLVLLDHEVAHWGDGAFDIGFALTHLLSKAHHVAARRRAFLEAADRFWRSYVGETAGVLDSMFEHRAIRHTMGCLLARAFGRSPLEYLSQDERVAQCRAVLALLDEQPTSISELGAHFVAQVGRGRS